MGLFVILTIYYLYLFKYKRKALDLDPLQTEASAVSFGTLLSFNIMILYK